VDGVKIGVWGSLYLDDHGQEDVGLLRYGCVPLESQPIEAWKLSCFGGACSGRRLSLNAQRLNALIGQMIAGRTRQTCRTWHIALLPTLFW
jgi:hypothetical protein